MDTRKHLLLFASSPVSLCATPPGLGGQRQLLMKRMRQIFFIITSGQETEKHLTRESVPWGGWGLAGLSLSCFSWGCLLPYWGSIPNEQGSSEQSSNRVGGCCSSWWSNRLSLLFPFSSLPYSFVKVDSNMSICLWSLWGFLYSKRGHVQQHLERHSDCSCDSLSLRDRVFRKRSWGQEPDIRYVRCKNQYQDLCQIHTA